MGRRFDLDQWIAGHTSTNCAHSVAEVCDPIAYIQALFV